MTTDTTTIEDLAGQAYNQFQRVERGDQRITILKDDREDWVHDLVYAAHGDFGPDDWRYDAIRSALSEIHDVGGDLDDLAHEWADGNVDTYTRARFAWLASNLNRQYYCDEAIADGLASEDTDLVTRVGLGQYEESLEIFQAVRQALEDKLESRDDENE